MAKKKEAVYDNRKNAEYRIRYPDGPIIGPNIQYIQ